MLMLLEPADVDRLREALTAAGYTFDGIADRLGADAMAATARGDYRSTLAATAGGDRQATLIRLFMCGGSEPAESVTAALAPMPVDTAVSAGLLVADGDDYRAGLALACHGPHWLLSDLPSELGGTITADHVLGAGGAANALAGYLVRRPVDSALDIGTGCGVQALKLASHARTVTATDVLPRALRFAATNAALNEADWELLRGDMLNPVAGRRFDQVVSNPPFIVGPGSTDFTYRDSGRAADGICAELARAASELLNPGGTMQFLANWVQVRGQDWRERVSGWFDGSGCDVWAIQRESADPLDYVRLWQRDSGRGHDAQELAAWLEWFDTNDIESVGFGIINVRHSGSADPVVVCEELRQQPVLPFDRLIADWFDTVEQLAGLTTQDLLGARLRLAPGVQLHQEADFGDSGWEVERQLLVDTARLGRRESIDPLLVSFLGGCSGTATMRTQVALLAQAHEAPEALLAASLVPVVRRLIQQGFLRIQ